MNMRMRLKKSVWRLTWTFQSDVEEEVDDDLDHENEIDKEFDEARGAKKKKIQLQGRLMIYGLWDEPFKTLVKVDSDVNEGLDDDHPYQNEIDEEFEEPRG